MSQEKTRTPLPGTIELRAEFIAWLNDIRLTADARWTYVYLLSLLSTHGVPMRGVPHTAILRIEDASVEKQLQRPDLMAGLQLLSLGANPLVREHGERALAIFVPEGARIPTLGMT